MKQLRFARLALIVLAALVLSSSMLPAQERGEGPLDPAQPKGVSPEEIIRHFAAREKEFKQAREQYTYRQMVKVQTLEGDTVDGEYQMVSDILFDDKGRRLEQVAFAPQSSLRRVSMSKEDYDDIRNQAPFVLTTDELADYNILYVGQQKQDELHCYVFDVAPKQVAKGRRYFQGRVWVDDKDLQIVKTRGKGVSLEEKPKKKKNPEEEQLFPTFTTWREQVDGVYWFPTYSRADETLHFRTDDVHIREIIKYTNYKKFGSKVKITYEGQDVKKGEEEEKKPK